MRIIREIMKKKNDIKEKEKRNKELREWNESETEKHNGEEETIT